MSRPHRLYVIELYDSRAKKWRLAFDVLAPLHQGWAHDLCRTVFPTRASAEAELMRYGPPCRARVAVYADTGLLLLKRKDKTIERRLRNQRRTGDRREGGAANEQRRRVRARS